jgi:LmbE family N-acetylglucosaminyl deacetylase
MISFKAKRILVLAPHTDDGELGCGGSIARFVEEGASVYCVAFSIAEDSVPAGFAKEALAIEFTQAMQALGLKPAQIRFHRFRVRHFPEYRQQILQTLIDLRSELEPDIIFLPSLNDIHQDHQVISNEGLRAFKKSSILGYEMPWNNIVFETRCFVELKEHHIELKVAALKKYASQQHRSYLSSDFIKGLAVTRGTQFESKYAEAFEVIRWIL